MIWYPQLNSLFKIQVIKNPSKIREWQNVLVPPHSKPALKSKMKKTALKSRNGNTVLIPPRTKPALKLKSPKAHLNFKSPKTHLKSKSSKTHPNSGNNKHVLVPPFPVLLNGFIVLRGLEQMFNSVIPLVQEALEVTLTVLTILSVSMT